MKECKEYKYTENERKMIRYITEDREVYFDDDYDSEENSEKFPLIGLLIS